MNKESRFLAHYLKYQTIQTQQLVLCVTSKEMSWNQSYNRLFWRTCWSASNS